MLLIIYENENGKGWAKAKTQETVDKFVNENNLNLDTCYYDVIDLNNEKLHNEITLLKDKLNQIRNIIE